MALLSRLVLHGAILSLLLTSLASRGASADAPVSANGYFEVSRSTDAGWRSIGRVPFGQRFSVADLGGLDAGNGGLVRLRLEKRGGGLAHLDRVSVGGRAPLASDAVESAKLEASEFDVIDATEPLELAFDLTGLSGEVNVQLDGRIEAVEIPKVPFRFPTTNTYGEITDSSWFYRYPLGGTEGNLSMDGDLGSERLGEPFFVQSFPVGSGHPDGDVYGWVMNDDENLFVAMDFTPDNTVDDGADYASVHIRTAQGIRTYTVSASRRDHGVQGFVYTEAVAYQHMVYEFSIPLADLGHTKSLEGLELAFSAYGTATPQTFYEIAYNPNANEHMVVYSRYGTSDMDIFGQLFDADGNPIGDEIAISTAVGSQVMPNLAFDPADDRYLVVWHDYRDSGDFHALYGQMVNGDGTLVDHDGDTIPEPDEDNRNLDDGWGVDEHVLPDIEFDASFDQFLVSYVNGDSWVVVLPVASDGSAAATASTVSDYSGWYMSTDLSIDPSSGGAMVIYSEDVEGVDVLARPVSSTGTTVGGEIDVSWGEYGNQPAIAFAPTIGEYLGVMAHSYDGIVYGRMFDSAGAMAAPELEYYASEPYIYGTDVVWDSARGRYFFVWAEDSESWVVPDHIRADFIEADGGLDDAGILVASTDGGVAHMPDVAYNSECANFAVAYANSEMSLGFDVAIVGGCVGIDVGPASGPTTEAGVIATIPVTMDARPEAPVDVGVGVDDGTEISVDPTVLTFTPADWSVAKVVTVTGVDDTLVDGDQTVNVVFADAVSDDGAYDGMPVSTAEVINQDDDAPAIIVGDISGPVSETGSTATFTVVLQTEPVADVTIGLSSDDEGEGAVAPAGLTFTSSDWSDPQTVSVTGVDDDELDGDQTFNIVLDQAASSDTDYAGLDPADVAAVNQDDDLGPPTLEWVSGATSGVLPETGPRGTEFAFGVVYTSPDNRAPVQTDLHIDFDGQEGEGDGALGFLGTTGGNPSALVMLLLGVLSLMLIAFSRSRFAPAVAVVSLLLIIGGPSACGDKEEDDDIDASVCEGEDGTVETFDLVEVDPSDTDYSDGKIYGVAMTICAQGTFDYTFQFNDGVQDAIGDPTSPHSFTVEGNQ